LSYKREAATGLRSIEKRKYGLWLSSPADSRRLASPLKTKKLRVAYLLDLSTTSFINTSQHQKTLLCVVYRQHFSELYGSGKIFFDFMRKPYFGFNGSS
jgi:hypothetical protein